MGLNRLDKKTGECVRYTTANGLGDNVINGILADDYGNLWLSTNKGLSCFNIAHTYFRNYTTVDGLVNTEFNHQTYTKRPNGQLLFGGIDGIDALYPKDFLPDTTFAPVYFTALKINNKPVVVRDESGILPRSLAYTDAIYLRHTQNMVTVGFAALRFDKFGTESYQYKLEGADPDWVLAGSRTEASYSNLSPGNYTLSVASLNEAGDRNPHLTVLYITIAAPWWRTWAAYFCYALFLLLIAYFVVQAQIKRVRLQDEVTYKEKEAQQMQALDELKSRFFANITHEFRTPLTLIVEPARQIAETDSIDLAHVQVHIIRNNANRLLALVNQLLDLSKIESGKVQINWSEGDLWLIIEEVTTWFQPVIDKKRQILRIECALDTLEGITDRQGLEKIVYNLLSNAHKFTPEGGTITVKVTQPAPDSWQIEVKDNGIGIAPEKLPHIFDRFYQADNALTRSNEGTGIGLALVKELTELLGGTIAVASELGKGTTFTLTFPTRSAAAEGQYTTDKTVSALLEREMEAAIAQVVTNETDTADRSTVLLVEDNADMRQYLELVLTQKGYAVLQAENGRIGLEKARETVPDLIITDVMMPEMDGYELTEKLKNNPITSHIPIMILTAKGRQESKLTGYRKGADAYLPKPFQTEEVLIRLQQLLDTRRKMQQKYQATQLLPGENTPTPTDLAPPQTDAPITSEPQIQQIDRDWIAQLAAIIEARLSDERFTVDDLPTLVYMSRTQFYAKVKALTGLTPARILRDIRLKTAYQLVVTQPDITLESLAKQVGVNDIRHFSIIFKQQFGISPQDIILKNKPY
jgi:signal transduction histidine kinase/DNA-binding response OmpR family regulator